MAEYGFTYRSVSTYNTTSSVRGERETRGLAVKSFAPFVPKVISGNPSEHVTKKIIVPVASRPFGDEGYHDDDLNHPQTNPVRGSPRKVDDFLTKVHNEASRPTKPSHVTSPDWHHYSHPTPFNGANSYGSNKPIGGTISNDNYDGYNGPNYDHGNKEGSKPIGGSIKNDNYDGFNGYGDYGSNKEGHKPIGGTIRNDKYDGYNGANGFGDYGSNKEGGKPIGGTIRDENQDGYNGTNGYGDYGNYGNKEGHKPIGNPVKKDRYDGYNGPHGYGGDYGNKEAHKPIGNPVKKDRYDGYSGPYGYGGDYGNKEGHKPIGNSVRKDKYDDYNGPYGYGGDYENKEGHKPIGSPIKKDKYDGYNNGDGGGDYGNRDGRKLMGSPVKNDSYGYSGPKGNGGYGNMDRYDGYSGPYGYGGDYGNKEGYKPTGIGGERKISSDWAAAPRKGIQLSEPTHDIEKAMELLWNEGAKKLNGHGNTGPKPYENDKKNDRTRPRFTTIDGRGTNHRDDIRRGYGTIDHKEAERTFNGMTL